MALDKQWKAAPTDPRFRKADKDALEKEALAHPNVQKWIEGKTIRKVIVVPGRRVNIAVS